MRRGINLTAELTDIAALGAFPQGVTRDTIEVAGEKEIIPLAGAAPHIPALEKLCLRK